MCYNTSHNSTVLMCPSVITRECIPSRFFTAFNFPLLDTVNMQFAMLSLLLKTLSELLAYHVLRYRRYGFGAQVARICHDSSHVAHCGMGHDQNVPEFAQRRLLAWEDGTHYIIYTPRCVMHVLEFHASVGQETFRFQLRIFRGPLLDRPL